jgi:hypothetical protein
MDEIFCKAGLLARVGSSSSGELFQLSRYIWSAKSTVKLCQVFAVALVGLG